MYSQTRGCKTFHVKDPQKNPYQTEALPYFYVKRLEGVLRITKNYPNAPKRIPKYPKLLKQLTKSLAYKCIKKYPKMLSCSNVSQSSQTITQLYPGVPRNQPLHRSTQMCPEVLKRTPQSLKRYPKVTQKYIWGNSLGWLLLIRIPFQITESIL